MATPAPINDLMLVVLALACSAPAPEPRPPAPTGARPEEAWPATYAGELAALDRRIAFVGGRSEQPTRRGQLVEALTERARLTGALADWSAADAAAADGPPLPRARLDLALHRFDRAPPELAAQVAFARGDHDAARAGFEADEGREPTHTTAARLAILAWKTGDRATAETWLRTALKRYHGRSHQPRAWVHLHLGLLDLDAGDYDAALAHYADADAAMAGWWLVREHVAEAHRLAGRPAVARPIYEAVVAETGHPELMDALALTLRDLGAADAAAEWHGRAEDGWNAYLARFPEAFWGHAVDHWSATDPARALALARSDHANRPDGDTTLALAEALLATGDRDAARALVVGLRAGPWRPAGLADLEAALR